MRSIWNRLPLLIVAIAISSSSIQADTVGSLDEALALAAERGTVVVIDFWADWCGPCKRFDAASESDPELSELIGKIALFKTDAEKAGFDLATEFDVTGYPTYLVLTAEREVLSRWWGYDTSEGWVQVVNEVLADPITEAARKARFAEGPTPEDAKILARIAFTAGNHVRSVELYRQLQEMEPAQAADYNTLIFDVSYRGYREDEFSFEQLNSAATAAMESKSTNHDEMIFVASTMFTAAREEDEIAVGAGYLETAMDRTEFIQDESVQRRRTGLEISYLLHVTGDRERAVELRRSLLPDGWEQDASQMNGFAWWCFKNDANLEEAEDVARRAVDLATTDSHKSNILDTVAEICNARGNCRDAVSLIEQALALQPDSKSLQKQLERFEVLLAAAE